MVKQTDYRNDVSKAAERIVTLGNNTPMGEKTAGTAGTGNEASRFDHRHPRTISPHTGDLDSSGQALLVFSRTFVTEPAMAYGWVEADNNLPVMFKVVRWQKLNPSGNGLLDWTPGAIYAGAVIKGYRGQLLPALTNIVLVGPLIAALVNFNVFGGNASGVHFSATAIQIGD